MKKIAVVMIDAQVDFTTGMLGNPEADAATNVIHEIVEWGDERDEVTFYDTKDTHYKEFYMDSQEGKNLPIFHTLLNTPGWELDSRVIPKKHRIELLKNTFGYNYWEQEHMSQYDLIIVVGFCSNICHGVNTLILKTVAPEVPIIVISDACAGTTPEEHEAALKMIRSCQVKVMTWEEFKNSYSF